MNTDERWKVAVILNLIVLSASAAAAARGVEWMVPLVAFSAFLLGGLIERALTGEGKAE